MEQMGREMRQRCLAGIRWCCVTVLLSGLLLGGAPSPTLAAPSSAMPRTSPWQQLITQARAMGLPVQFLEIIPEDFVTIEFEDLHTYAAEYHPEAHRMVLNRTLSFNVAGSVLRPLRTLHHRDIGTLFHELFHAYMDFLVAHPPAVGEEGARARLLAFARDRQACRYTQVEITPIVQRRGATESRELADEEAWEALNETWAVFVGWAVWTKLEARAASGEQGAAGGERGHASDLDADWFARLARANERGELRGYYEPGDQEERELTKKRYLSLSYRIAPEEARMLMASIMEVSEEAAHALDRRLREDEEPLVVGEHCRAYPLENLHHAPPGVPAKP